MILFRKKEEKKNLRKEYGKRLPLVPFFKIKYKKLAKKNYKSFLKELKEVKKNIRYDKKELKKINKVLTYDTEYSDDITQKVNLTNRKVELIEDLDNQQIKLSNNIIPELEKYTWVLRKPKKFIRKYYLEEYPYTFDDLSEDNENIDEEEQYDDDNQNVQNELLEKARYFVEKYGDNFAYNEDGQEKTIEQIVMDGMHCEDMEQAYKYIGKYGNDFAYNEDGSAKTFEQIIIDGIQREELEKLAAEQKYFYNKDNFESNLDEEGKYSLVGDQIIDNKYYFETKKLAVNNIMTTDDIIRESYVNENFDKFAELFNNILDNRMNIDDILLLVNTFINSNLKEEKIIVDDVNNVNIKKNDNIIVDDIELVNTDSMSKSTADISKEDHTDTSKGNLSIDEIIEILESLRSYKNVDNTDEITSNNMINDAINKQIQVEQAIKEDVVDHYVEAESVSSTDSINDAISIFSK